MKVIEDSCGWYRVEANGQTIGYVGQQKDVWKHTLPARAKVYQDYWLVSKDKESFLCLLGALRRFPLRQYAVQALLDS
ncbi:hypothetical protein AMR41_30910 [Hapalosiphon sp. MRB220]|nr:hypothetical protein AMR41_30910 [Hapalosiphon sp. MRB220]